MRSLRLSPVGSGALIDSYVMCNVPSPTVDVKTVIGNLGPIALQHGAYCVPFRLDIHHFLPLKIGIKIISEVESVIDTSFEVG